MPLRFTTWLNDFSPLIIAEADNQICLCDWLFSPKHPLIFKKLKLTFGNDAEETRTPLIDDAIAQLSEYLSGDRRSFELPITLTGSDFRKKVWHELMQIPYGQTLSYLELATKIGSPSSVRAVANAVAFNPISIIVPCHRVIGSNGKPTGYAGGIETKCALLALEAATLQAP